MGVFYLKEEETTTILSGNLKVFYKIIYHSRNSKCYRFRRGKKPVTTLAVTLPAR